MIVAVLRDWEYVWKRVLELKWDTRCITTSIDNTKGNWPIGDLRVIVVSFSDREHIWVTIVIISVDAG